MLYSAHFFSMNSMTRAIKYLNHKLCSTHEFFLYVFDDLVNKIFKIQIMFCAWILLCEFHDISTKCYNHKLRFVHGFFCMNSLKWAIKYLKYKL